MSAVLYNPASEQRVVLISDRGMAFSIRAATSEKVYFSDRGVDLDRLLAEGWQIASVTASGQHEILFLVVLERRLAGR